MAESYNIIFCSNNASNRSGTEPNGYTYATRWSTVIPTELQTRKFVMTWSLNTEIQTAASALACIYANLGASPAVVDQSYNRSLILGAIMPSVTWNGTEYSYQYHSGAADSCLITTSYPNLDQVTVSVRDIDGQPVVDFPEYVLILSFTPIDE